MNNPHGLTPPEILTICRLRQWSSDRTTLRGGKTTDYRREGYTPRNNRAADAKLVRVIDFGRALANLTEKEQALLLLTYAAKETRYETARAMHCSTRSIDYHLRPALKRLASILERLDLL